MVVSSRTRVIRVEEGEECQALEGVELHVEELHALVELRVGELTGFIHVEHVKDQLHLDHLIGVAEVVRRSGGRECVSCVSLT